MIRSNFLLLANSLLKVVDEGMLRPHWSTCSSQNVPGSVGPPSLHWAPICDFSLERPFLTYLLGWDLFLFQYLRNVSWNTTLPLLSKAPLSHIHWVQCLPFLQCIFVVTFNKLCIIYSFLLLEGREGKNSIDAYYNVLGGWGNDPLPLKLAKTGWNVKSNDLELHSVVDTVSVPLRSLQSCFPFLCIPPVYYCVFLKACSCPSSGNCFRATLPVLPDTQNMGRMWPSHLPPVQPLAEIDWELDQGGKAQPPGL